ncbi:MAG: hypothetical protein IPM98_04585 [Lewinellaceae bacterium]|nr:hypothetical protein [Lewinellaceae bacterium]
MSIAFARDEKSIFISNEDGSLQHVTLAGPDGKVLRTWYGHNSEVYDMRSSASGQVLYTLSYDRTIKTWATDNPETPLRFFDLTSLKAEITSFACLSPDESELASLVSLSYPSQLSFFLPNGPSTPYWVYPEDMSLLVSATYDHTGNFLFTGFKDGRIEKTGTPKWFIQQEVADITLQLLIEYGFRIDPDTLLSNQNPQALPAIANYFYQAGNHKIAKEKWEKAVQTNPTGTNYIGLYTTEHALGINRLSDYLTLSPDILLAFAEHFKKTLEWGNAKLFYEKLLANAKTKEDGIRFRVAIHEVSLRGGIFIDKNTFFDFSEDIYYEMYYNLTLYFRNAWSKSQQVVLSEDICQILEKQYQYLLKAGIATENDSSSYISDYATYYAIAGRILFNKRQHQRSIHCFKKSYDIFPHPSNTEGIALNLLILDRLDDAKQLYSDALSAKIIKDKKEAVLGLKEIAESEILHSGKMADLQNLIQWLENL